MLETSAASAKNRGKLFQDLGVCDILADILLHRCLQEIFNMLEGKKNSTGQNTEYKEEKRGHADEFCRDAESLRRKHPSCQFSSDRTSFGFTKNRERHLDAEFCHGLHIEDLDPVRLRMTGIRAMGCLQEP